VRPGLDFFSLIFAIFKVGAVPVVVDPGMGVRRMLACFHSTRPQAFVGIPLAHAVRSVFRKAFKTVRYRVTVGRRWFWGGPTLTQLRAREWTPFAAARTRPSDMAAILFTISAWGTATASNFDLFVIYRIIGGIGIGLASALSPMYIAEVSPPAWRGRLVAMNQMTIVIGILAAQFANLLIAQKVPDGATDEFDRVFFATTNCKGMVE
jgi:MFS family permease